MNWKRIGRVIICLLVVCCLIVNMSPLRAEATGFEVGLIAVSAAVVVGTIMIGLGVMPQNGSTAFDDLVNSCVSDLSSTGTYVVDGIVNVARVISGQKLEYGVAQNLIEAVRSWLFSSNTLQTVTAVTGSTIVASTVVGPVSSWAMNRSLNALRASSPANLLQLFSLLGLYENVFIYSQDETYLYGFFFDPNGVLCSAAFVNPLGAVHSSLFGTYHVLDVEFDYSVEIQQVHLVYKSYISTFRYDIPVFYNASCLLGYSGISTLEAACFDWSRNPVEHTQTTGSNYTDFYFYKKAATDSVIGEYSSTYGFSNYLEGTYCIGAFTWDTVTSTEVVTSASVSLGHVADEDDSLAVGYPLWSSGVITVPGVSSGEDDGSDVYYPYFPNFDSNNFNDLTQSEVWEGSVSTSDSTIETPDNTGLLSQILSAIKAIPAAIYDFMEAHFADVKSLPEAFSGWFENIISGIEAIPGAFAGWFSDVIDGVLSIPAAIGGVFEDVITGVVALPTTIYNAVVSAVEAVFVPSEDFLTEKVDALRSEFSFADSIITTAEYIGTALSGLETEPPVIYIDLGASEGSYYLGGKEVFVDLNWYSRYKPTVDLLISAFLWIVFVWRLFVKLPGIISGMPGDFVMDGVYDLGLSDSLPPRKGAYEVQRQSLRQSSRKGSGK